MQILTFTVKDQILTAECPGRVVVEASRRHVFARFELDGAWDGLTVTAVFQNDFVPQAYERLWTGEPVEVPQEVLVRGKLRVSLVGLGDGGAYRLTTRRMQTPVSVFQSGPLVALTPEEATPELWEQVAAALTQQLADAQAAAEGAQTAKAAAEASRDDAVDSAAAAAGSAGDAQAAAEDARASKTAAETAQSGAADYAAAAAQSAEAAKASVDNAKMVLFEITAGGELLLHAINEPAVDFRINTAGELEVMYT